MSGVKSPSFSFYPDNWLGGTMAMTPVQRAAYIDLICLGWVHGPFTREVAHMACRGVTKTDVDAVLSAKFILENGVYYNARQEHERKKQQSYAENGRRGASNRWSENGKPHGKQDGKSYGKPHSETMLTVTVPVTDSNTTTDRQTDVVGRLSSLNVEFVNRQMRTFRERTDVTKTEVPPIDVLMVVAISEMLGNRLQKDLIQEFSTKHIQKPGRYVKAAIRKQCEENGVDEAEFRNACKEWVNAQNTDGHSSGAAK